MNPSRAFFLFLTATLGLGCGSTAMNHPGSGGSATGGQETSSGGMPGTGGSISDGGALGSGGSGSGGTVGRGGSPGTGGTKLGTGGGMTGGSNNGGAAGGVSGTGGTTCPMMGVCPTIACPYGELPSPEPCSCPICAPAPDAGAKDAAADACPALPCIPLVCTVGYVTMTRPCGCPTCVPIDAGQPDATADTGKLACVGLDECSCVNSQGCGVVAESCYCSGPKCTSAVCKCGGGRFVGCAPQDLVTCAAAKSRVATLCPSLAGATFDGLCSQADALCVTKCLNEVTSCGDLTCSMCEACDCATDAFMRCRGSCRTALAK